MLTKVCVVVPTYNAGEQWQAWIAAIQQQHGVLPNQVLVIDSSSTDDTVRLSREAGFRVHVIAKSDFNHGGTRQLAISLLPDDAQIVVMLTQDALLADSSAIERLVSVFDNPRIGCAYGRQLPHQQARHLGRHARLFNYTQQSYTRTMDDVSKFGIKTAFLSNSFAAYRVSALKIVGGFPLDVILAEDMIVAAKMLQRGYAVGYVADACVYHSHDYTPWQEFSRYFDIGVLHARQTWLLDTFGKPTGEGKRFVLSEWRYLLKQAPFLLPLAILNTFMKWTGYQLGKHEASLPLWLKPKLSMYKGFWRL
jgi:rhamnosyltransferase